MQIAILRRLAAAGLVAAVSLPAAMAVAAPQTLSGVVTYRERLALPPSARIEVRLVDVSRADAPYRTIASTTVKAKGQAPFSYRLHYDDADIVSGRSYALRARVTVGDQLWFATTTHHPMFKGGASDTTIVVERVGSSPRRISSEGAPAGPAGRWLAEDIRGGGVIDRLQTTLEIGADGTITGSGGCNRMSGKATISGENIKFAPLASTNMACSPAIMDQEGKFFAALMEVRAWRIDPARRKLALLDGAGKTLIVFAQM